MSEREPIEVVADWQGLREAMSVGWLHRSIVRGEEVLSFEYAREWLDRGAPLLLDPKLQFVAGRQYPDASGAFGLFLDSAPDRWGRLLIRRRAALEASGGAPVLFDSDYLLAVSDCCRMGGLRFRSRTDGPFLAENQPYSVPPLQALRSLEQASLQFERADSDEPEYAEWLRLLLAPGSSLGGARPKGNVEAPDGHLWIAKFPSREDLYDVGAWEAVVYDLAEQAGLRTGTARAESFSRAGHTFLTRRFDRSEAGERIHFASAMNLLGYVDGDGAKSGSSYLDLVELIERHGSQVEADLEELWRRVVFSVCVGNTDDHLRNHGFLLGRNGWRLSPVYDLNPNPHASGLALNIDEASNACDLDLVCSVGQYFRLSDQRQAAVLEEVRAAVKEWEVRARERGIVRREVEEMRPAFRLSK